MQVTIFSPLIETSLHELLFEVVEMFVLAILFDPGLLSGGTDGRSRASSEGVLSAGSGSGHSAALGTQSAAGLLS